MIPSGIHITHWGDRGERVIMIHGSAQGSKVGGDHHFSRQRALAARGWQVIVPDRPGHGRSPDPGRPDDAEADGAWVADLLGDGAHLVGHSFGGCVALAAAAKRPEAVRSLTLIEPAMQRLATSDPAVRKFAFRMLAILFLSWSDESRIKKFANLVAIPDAIRGGSGPAELKRMGQAIKRLRLPSGETIGRQLDIVCDQGIPLLVVTGGWSAAFEAVGRTVAARGGGTHVVIPAPHHFPQLVSDEFNDRLEALMREREPAAFD